MQFESHSVAQTEQVAVDLARTLSAGDCIALEGELGAGKTQFVRGLLRGLGGDPRAVSSPTYVLLHIYDSAADDADRQRLPLFHLDAYRVGGEEELEAIGFAELLEQGGVVVVEWASRVSRSLPARHIQVDITSQGESDRLIVIRRPEPTVR